MQSRWREPINLGTDRMITINDLARIVIEISGKDGIDLVHVAGPQGVRGRNSDNARLREVRVGSQPPRSREALVPTYRWIEQAVCDSRATALPPRTLARHLMTPYSDDLRPSLTVRLVALASHCIGGSPTADPMEGLECYL